MKEKILKRSMGRRLLSIVLALAMVISLLPTSCTIAKAQIDPEYTYDEATKTLTFTATDEWGTLYSYQVTSAREAYPDATSVIISGYGSIDSEAFKGNTTIESLDIDLHAVDMGIGTIRSLAFENCTSLKSVVISCNQIMAFEGDAFKGCSALESMTINANFLIPMDNAFSSVGTSEKPVKLYLPADMDTSSCGYPTSTSTAWYGGYFDCVIGSQLTFTAEEAGSTVSFDWNGGSNVQIKVSSTEDTIGGTAAASSDAWVDYTPGTEIKLTNVGDTVAFKGTNVVTDYGHHFNMTGKIAASGDVTSLTDGLGGDADLTYAYNCYYSMFCDCTSLTSAPALPATNLNYGCYYDMFYGCTSLTSAPALPATSLAMYCYFGMFANCSSLKTAPALPATTLYSACYQSMFSGCSSLETAPALSATTMVSGCYYNMFSGCTSLKTAPALEATSLASQCYYGMFENCSSLETAPNLPATSLGADTSCYAYMFSGCSSLKTAPALPATTLCTDCYYYMFSGCSSLETAPNLPAATLYSGCYQGMFSGCTSLKTAPELPATTLSAYCYTSMFANCSSLETAPELPAATMVAQCYSSMFYGCSSLKAAPELSATSLAQGCYASMFANCSSLKTAPALPATALENSCYSYMFSGCTSLETAPALPATDLTEECYNSMFRGCTSLTSVPELKATTMKNYCYANMFAYCTDIKITEVASADAATWVLPSSDATKWNNDMINRDYAVNASGDVITAVEAGKMYKVEYIGDPKSVDVKDKDFTYLISADYSYTSDVSDDKEGTLPLGGISFTNGSGSTVKYVIATSEKNVASGESVKMSRVDVEEMLSEASITGKTEKNSKLKLAYDATNHVVTLSAVQDPVAKMYVFTAPASGEAGKAGSATVTLSELNENFTKYYGTPGAITVYYSKAGKEDWSTTVPTEAGDYNVAIDVAAGTAGKVSEFAVVSKLTSEDWKYTIYDYISKWEASSDASANASSIENIKALIASADPGQTIKIVADEGTDLPSITASGDCADSVVKKSSSETNVTIPEGYKAKVEIVSADAEPYGVKVNVSFYKVYTITYNTNGGSEVEPAKYVTAIPEILPTTTKEGYIFEGWFTDSDCKVAAVSGDAISGDATLYADWSVDPDCVAADAVKALIDEIGTVTLTDASKAKVDAARKAYDALTDAQKAKITADQLKVLTDAEAKYAELKAAADKAAAEKAAAEKAAAEKAAAAAKAAAEKAAAAAEKAAAAAEKAAALAAQVSMNKKLKVTQSGNKLVLTWGKAKGAAGYKIYASYQGEAYKVIKTVKSTKLTINVKKLNDEKLDLTKIFRFRVAAYKVVNGKQKNIGKTLVVRLVGNKNKTFTNAKKIKLTTKTVTLSAGKTAKIKATTVLEDTTKKQLSNKYSKEFRYLSTNKKVAKVNKNGKITAVAKGTCYVYVYSRNGLAKKVTVTVQ